MQNKSAIAPLRAVPTDTRSHAGPSDAALVLSARAGELWAWEALFRRHAPMIIGLAYRLMGRDSDVDDLVQDTFVEAFVSLHRLGEPGAFAKWLASITVRTAAKVFRRRRLLVRLGISSPSGPLDLESIAGRLASPEVGAELQRMYEKLERLPASQRVPFLLRNVEGLQLAEIAAILGVSLATTKRRVSEAEAALEAMMTEQRR